MTLEEIYADQRATGHRGPDWRIRIVYALAKHTGKDMIFPYWELDQDRRCQSLTDDWSGYRSPIGN